MPYFDLHICFLHAYHSDGKALQLSSRQKIDVTIPHLPEFCAIVSRCSSSTLILQLTEHVCDFIQSLLTNLTPLRHLEAYRTVLTLDSFRNLIHVLRLRDSLEIILQHLGEVVYSAISISHLLSIPLLYSLCSSEPLKYFRISSQSGGSSYLPKFGFSFPASIFNAVLLPIPFVPTRPKTWPGRGIGKRCNLKLLAL